jgi:hypothetical protein
MVAFQVNNKLINLSATTMLESIEYSSYLSEATRFLRL